MWRWQPSERHKLKRTLLIISCLLHALVLGWLLFLYRGDDIYHLFVGKNVPNLCEAKIVVMPFQKGIRYQSGSGKGSKGTGKVAGGKQVAKKVTPKNTKKPSTTMATDRKKTQKVAKKPEKKKEEKKPTSAQKKREKAPVKPKKKEVKKEVKKEPVVKKEPEKPKEKVAQKEPEKSKELPNKDEQPKEELKVAQKEEPAPIEQPLPAVEPMPTDGGVAGDQEGPVMFVGQQEMLLLQMQQDVQQEVERCWKPPVGLSRDLICEVRVCVDELGAIKNVKVEKATGVLVYDVNARSTVLAMNFPKSAWGKELVLHFKQ